jgi:hypothetical protein
MVAKSRVYCTAEWIKRLYALSAYAIQSYDLLSVPTRRACNRSIQLEVQYTRDEFDPLLMQEYWTTS